MTTSSGLTDGSAPPARQFCVVDAVTPSSGISIRTSRDSSPSGQITTVASKLASVQIWPLASGAARISGRSAGLTALLPSAQYIILDDYGTAGEDTKWVICFAAVGLRKEQQQQQKPKVLTDHGDEIGRKYSRHFSRGVCTSWKHGGWFGERENEGNVWV